MYIRNLRVGDAGDLVKIPETDRKQRYLPIFNKPYRFCIVLYLIISVKDIIQVRPLPQFLLGYVVSTAPRTRGRARE